MRAQKQPSKRTLGIDFGMRRMGLALSDERGIIASPLETFHTENKTPQTIIKLLATIAEICQKYRCEIEKIVIGLPLMMSGRHGLLADEVDHFVKLLKESTTIPIFTWDERLSTVQAERSLRESSLSRKKRTKVVDIVSAAIILQSYLDLQNQIKFDSI